MKSMKKQTLLIATIVLGFIPVLTELIYAHKWSAHSNKDTSLVLIISLVLIGLGAISFAVYEFYFGYSTNRSKLFRLSKALGLGIVYYFATLIIWDIAEFTAFRG
jgi:VIT1/CCC1 family predicted Fe2+/Mn2+ transporter